MRPIVALVTGALALIGACEDAVVPDEVSVGPGPPTFGNASGGPAPRPDGGLNPDCVREVSAMAVELDELPPFDVVIVADHSGSLGWSREDLAEGLSTLLAEVRGHTARVFVLTPTQYGATTSEAIDPALGTDIVLWRDEFTRMPFEHAMTEYTQVCLDAQGEEITCPMDTSQPGVSMEGTFRFLMPDPVATITPELDDAELAVEQEAVSEAILSLGGTGSPVEQPLCTLNRYVLQDPAVLPERAVFVVISDEDHVAPASDCLAGFEYSSFEAVSDRVPCDEGCERYEYFAARLRLDRRIEFECVPVDDAGTPHLDLAVPRGWSVDEGTDPSCQATEPVACRDEDVPDPAQACGVNRVVQSCRSLCRQVRLLDCTLETRAEADRCSEPFTHDGTAYGSHLEYCDATVGDLGWYGCGRRGFTTGVVDRQSRRRIELLPDGDGLVPGFLRAALEHFGESGFQVQVIGFDPDFECQPGPGQSHATALRELTARDGGGDIFPICGDYAPALAGIRGFAQRLLQTEIALELEPTETIASVRVREPGGNDRELPASGYRYDATTGILHVDGGALTPTDLALSVEIVDSCSGTVE